MSRVKMMCMFATMLALSIVCSAQAAKAVAQKLCDQLNQSIANKDLSGQLGFYDSSFIKTDQRGKRTGFAEFRKQTEQALPNFRRIHPSTTVENVRLEGDRMVVTYKDEWYFEFHEQRDGWVPEIYKGSGEDTWERKGGQWKMVASTTFRAERQFDPVWVELQKSAYRKAGEICLTEKPCDH